MLLIDLNPRFVGAGGEGISDAHGNPVPKRVGVGLSFDCPCGCGVRCYVDFQNPLDGGDPHSKRGPFWNREGDTFHDLTLKPSIFRSPEKGGCGWHGWIENGKVRTV